MTLSDEKLAAMSPQKRASLYTNAKSHGTPEGDNLAKRIEEMGLPYSEGSGVNMDDPLVVKMFEIIYSEEGRAAARKAADEGSPALAGVDPMIAKALGVDYGMHNMTTNTAGYLVADLMREMGYRDTGRIGTLPPGSVAKSAKVWIAK